MKKKIKSKVKRVAAKRLSAKKSKPKSDGKVTIHPSGHDVKVSPERAKAYRLAKRTA